MADLHKKGPFNRDCLWLTYIKKGPFNRDCLSLGSSCPVPRPCLHNFWEVCTFRLVRISTPEDMFASGEEMGKDVVLFTQLATFCFDLPFSSN